LINEILTNSNTTICSTTVILTVRASSRKRIIGAGNASFEGTLALEGGATDALLGTNIIEEDLPNASRE
jgi:hypothetical protein